MKKNRFVTYLALLAALSVQTWPVNPAFAGELLDAVKKRDVQKAAAVIKSKPESIGEIEKYETGPLHMAALKDSKEIIKLLIDNKAPVNQLDYFKKTPIFLAGSVEAAELLISAGADIHVKDKNENGLLHEAVKSKKAEMIDYYIKKGLDINLKNSAGQTPLALSIENNEFKIFMSLINAGADVNVKENFFEWSPLHIAVMNARKDMAEVLIDKKAGIEAADRYGKTPIHYVKSKDMAEFLISKKADISSKSKKGENIIHSTAAAGNTEALAYFIDKGFDINAADVEGKTPFYKAILHKSKSAAKLLIEKGADINAGENALFTAIYSNGTEAVSMLLEHGVKIDAVDKYKNGAMHICESIEMAELLLKNGADVNARDDNGGSPLHKIRKADLCGYLIEKGADINAQDALGTSPLMEAAGRADIEKTKLLLSKKADVKLKSAAGECAIHYAVRGFNEEKTAVYKQIIDELVSAGSDINARANFGETPIFSAFQPELLKHAIEKGADVKARDNFGRSALHRAMNAEIAGALLDKGIEIEDKDINGATPLCYAASYDRELAGYLISKGANVNARGFGVKNVRRGSMEHLWQSPLLMAAYYRKADIAELLLAGGANVNAGGDDGKAAVHLAAMAGSKSVIELLIKNKADLNLTDRYGNTPLKLALENDKIEAAEILRKNGAR